MAPDSRFDDDAHLVSRLQRGDPGAIDALIDSCSEPLYRFIHFRLGGTPQETEEIVQETFVAALESARRFRGDSTLFTWLCGIARRRVAHLRRTRYRDRIAVALESADEEIESMLAQIDETELPSEVLERAETREIVGAVMASLPPDYQDVLEAKYYAARPVDDIAAERGQSPKAVESLLTRARSAFRKTFKIVTRHLSGGGRA